jgi:penicillin-binding protein-related factor A (putative recombinase)
MGRLLEKDIEKAILRYLELLPECYAWRNNTMGVYDAKKGIYRGTWSKYSIKGVSDIIGVYKGRPLFLEVKRDEKTKPTFHQQMFLRRVKDLGAIAEVVWSVEQVKELLKSI